LIPGKKRNEITPNKMDRRCPRKPQLTIFIL
jgi:hypothetical protein